MFSLPLLLARMLIYFLSKLLLNSKLFTSKEPLHLTWAQSQALKKLKSYKHLTIKASDRGGNIVVLDNSHYRKICLDLLNSPTWYRKMERFTSNFYSLVDEAFHNQVINKTIQEFIRTEHAHLATFYCLPKTHNTGPTLTGRPIPDRKCQSLSRCNVTPTCRDASLLHKGYNLISKIHQMDDNSNFYFSCMHGCGMPLQQHSASVGC